MFYPLFHKIAVIIISALIGLGLYIPNETQPNFGNFNPSGGGTYRLQSSIGTTDTSLTLSSFKEPISNIPYTMSYLNSSVEYGTLEPTNSTKKEFISFTGITQNGDGTAQLTGLKRGLSFSYPYTASTTIAQTHSGQSIFVLSNTPQFYTTEFSRLNTNGTSTSFLTFSSTTPPSYDVSMNVGSQYASSSNLVTKGYVDAQTTAGCANADGVTKGCVSIGTKTQVASSTANGQGPSGTSYVIPTSVATSTPGGNNHTGVGNTYVVTTQDNGYINQNFIDLTQGYSWTGNHTFSGGLVSSATSTLSATTSIQGVSYVFPKSQGTLGNVLTNDGNGNLSWGGIATSTTVIPQSSCLATSTSLFAGSAIAVNTTALFGAVEVHNTITVNSISLEFTSVSGNPRAIIGMYDINGTSMFSTTTQALSSDGLQTFTLTNSTTLKPGTYYTGVNLVDGTSFGTVGWQCNGNQFNVITGKPKYVGSATVTAGTLPATIAPTTMTAGNSANTLLIRLDN